jgi:hypothetical protein
MTREEFIVAAEIAFERLMTPTRGLAPELMEQPMADGTWSFKDLAAHLIFWDGLVVRALEESMYGRTFDWGPYARHDEWNAQAVERLRPQTVKRVLTELRLTHSTAMDAVRRVPDERLLKAGEMPHFLTWIMVGHVEHHVPQVEAWAERMRQEGKAAPSLPILGG